MGETLLVLVYAAVLGWLVRRVAGLVRRASRRRLPPAVDAPAPTRPPTESVVVFRPRGRRAPALPPPPSGPSPTRGYRPATMCRKCGRPFSDPAHRPH